jgi:hypothetical protein
MATQTQYYEESQQVPQQQKTVAPYINDYGFGHSDLIKLALNSSDLMEELRMNILALEWDSTLKKFVRSKEKSAMINDYGAQKIITTISSIVNRNTHLSNITDIEIDNICRELEHNICHDFFDNWHKYWENEFDTESNWRMVRSMSGNFAKLALKRAKDGIERNILGGNTKTFINKQDIDSSQRITELPQRRFGIFK